MRRKGLNVFMDDQKKAPEGWVLVRDIPTVIRWLEKGLIHNLSLDHDMGGGTDALGKEINGEWLMKYIANRNIWPNGEINVHSENISGAKIMRGYIADKEKWQQMHREMAEERKNRQK